MQLLPNIGYHHRKPRVMPFFFSNYQSDHTVCKLLLYLFFIIFAAAAAVVVVVVVVVIRSKYRSQLFPYYFKMFTKAWMFSAVTSLVVLSFREVIFGTSLSMGEWPSYGYEVTVIIPLI